MKRIVWLTFFILLFLAAMALTIQAQTALQIYPDQNVGVLSSDPGSGERWSRSVFPFGNYTGTVTGEAIFCRTYLRFPLDGVPANSTIQSASLHVYVDDHWPTDAGAPMSVYQVTADWTTESVDWDHADWQSNWPSLGEPPVATTDVSTITGWFIWDVTDLAQDWVNGVSNQGLALAAAALNSTASNWAVARRLSADDAGTQPYLEITFVEPTPTFTPLPPTATPQPPDPTSTSQPSVPTATPVPVSTVTPTPLPVLLPATGQSTPAITPWLLLTGGLTALAGLVRFVLQRKAGDRGNE